MKLTEDECKALYLISQGCKNPEIAEKLGITEARVRKYIVYQLKKKLQLDSRVQLAIWAQEHQNDFDMSATIDCDHQNVAITEHVLSKRAYIILNGHLAERSADCSAMPRVFDVSCSDCGLEHTYRYAPGEFGPQSKPYWLYDLIEGVVCHVWNRSPVPNRRKA